MPRTSRVPTYRRHKQSGQAVVTLTDGLGGRRDILLGKYGTKESRAEYARQIAEWETRGRRLDIPTVASGLSMSELMIAYWNHAQGYYVKDGQPTSEPDNIRQVLRFVKALYEHTPARDFGPLALKAVRDSMIRHNVTRLVMERDPKTGEVVTDPETGKPRRVVKVLREGLTRKFINKQIDRIKRMFAWAVEQELLPAPVYQALACVAGLKKDRSAAREKKRVRPVPAELVTEILPHVPPVVATMVQVQYLCGGRPQDVVGMRAVDIDMTGPVWEYAPPRHKTEHHNDDGSPDRERIIFLGPKAQELLKPYLTLNVTDYLFSPERSEQERYTRRRQARRTKLWASAVRRRRRRYRMAWGTAYAVAAYRRAIRRACEKAGILLWTPNQLRHSRATEIRKRYGLEASQAVLGHSELGVTQVYAEVDRDAARMIMAEVG